VCYLMKGCMKDFSNNIILDSNRERVAFSNFGYFFFFQKYCGGMEMRFRLKPLF